MKTLALIVLGAAAVVGCATSASAQYLQPQWNYLGSPVCPSGYDYYQGVCMPFAQTPRGQRYYGFGRPRYYGGAVVPPRWNYRGSAVCPENYDYVGGMCRSRF